MKFEDILKFLKEGYPISRLGWPHNLKLCLHKPNKEVENIITEPFFYLIVDTNYRQACILTASDLLAEDWFFYKEILIDINLV